MDRATDVERRVARRERPDAREREREGAGEWTTNARVSRASRREQRWRMRGVRGHVDG